MLIQPAGSGDEKSLKMRDPGRLVKHLMKHPQRFHVFACILLNMQRSRPALALSLYCHFERSAFATCLSRVCEAEMRNLLACTRLNIANCIMMHAQRFLVFTSILHVMRCVRALGLNDRAASLQKADICNPPVNRCWQRS